MKVKWVNKMSVMSNGVEQGAVQSSCIIYYLFRWIIYSIKEMRILHW